MSLDRTDNLPHPPPVPNPDPTADAFITKWTCWRGHERQGYQEHFRDLCALVGQPAPHDPDTYCFEKGVTKTSGAKGWADVWKRGHFAVEYKAKGANLETALAQLQQYALALENTPLLVVCDVERYLLCRSEEISNDHALMEKDRRRYAGRPLRSRDASMLPLREGMESHSR